MYIKQSAQAFRRALIMEPFGKISRDGIIEEIRAMFEAMELGNNSFVSFTLSELENFAKDTFTNGMPNTISYMKEINPYLDEDEEIIFLNWW